ncbi:MAG: HAD family hydrolase [Candidatus Kapaibacterium sp.]
MTETIKHLTIHKQMMANNIECVLFDLGGVVVELTGVETMIAWSGGDITEEDVWHRWLHSEAVRSFESGQIEIAQFGVELVEELKLTVTPEEFLRGFGSWLGGTYRGTEQIIPLLRKSVAVGCLSNTNPLHWEIMTSQFTLHELFDHHFLSFEIGMMKPDREIFEHVVEKIGIPPRQILYFDDNKLNVEGAKSVGMVSRHAKGMEDVAKILREEGMVD